MPICISKWDFLICETFQSRRYRGCDIAAMSPWRPVCDIALRCRGNIAKCNNLVSQRYHRDFQGTVFQCRRILRWPCRNRDIVAMSPLLYRNATRLRYRPGMSRQHREVQQFSVAATFANVAATSLRHECDIKFLLGCFRNFQCNV